MWQLALALGAPATTRSVVVSAVSVPARACRWEMKESESSKKFVTENKFLMIFLLPYRIESVHDCLSVRLLRCQSIFVRFNSHYLFFANAITLAQRVPDYHFSAMYFQLKKFCHELTAIGRATTTLHCPMIVRRLAVVRNIANLLSLFFLLISHCDRVRYTASSSIDVAALIISSSEELQCRLSLIRHEMPVRWLESESVAVGGCVKACSQNRCVGELLMSRNPVTFNT